MRRAFRALPNFTWGFWPRRVLRRRTCQARMQARCCGGCCEEVRHGSGRDYHAPHYAVDVARPNHAGFASGAEPITPPRIPQFWGLECCRRCAAPFPPRPNSGMHRGIYFGIQAPIIIVNIELRSAPQCPPTYHPKSSQPPLPAPCAPGPAPPFGPGGRSIYGRQGRPGIHAGRTMGHGHRRMSGPGASGVFTNRTPPIPAGILPTGGGHKQFSRYQQALLPAGFS